MSSEYFETIDTYIIYILVSEHSLHNRLDITGSKRPRSHKKKMFWKYSTETNSTISFQWNLTRLTEFLLSETLTKRANFPLTINFRKLQISKIIHFACRYSVLKRLLSTVQIPVKKLKFFFNIAVTELNLHKNILEIFIIEILKTLSKLWMCKFYSFGFVLF